MKSPKLVVVFLIALLFSVCFNADAFADGKKGSGTGSSKSSSKVSSYHKKDGTHVTAHHRTTKDSSFRNNYSSKPNHNPHTGKTGTRITPPNKK